jgi:signal peptidase
VLFLDEKYTTKQQIMVLQKELEDTRKRTSKKTKSGKNKVLSIISWVVFILLLLGLSTILTSVLMAKSKGETPAVFGYQLYVVQSGSMEPTFNIGSVILSRIPGDPSKLKKGDVVTFTNDGVTITHRIFEVINDDGIVKYKTKGDNPENTVDPDLLTTDRVKAILVFRIPLT